MSTFFSKFPVIQYQGSSVVNITKAITLDVNAYDNPFSFNTYQIDASQRSDLVAEDVYNDPYMEWLIFLSNNKNDPYDWYMNQEQFLDFVNQKYGDYIVAQNKVKYYLNNWYNSNDIDPATFLSLEPVLTKYYQPNYDASGNEISYSRIPIDWIVNTNHLVQFASPTIQFPIFNIDEIVTIQYDTNIIGSGQVAFSSDEYLYVQHVNGNYLPVNNSINAAEFYISGQESNSIITIVGFDEIQINVVDTIDPLEDVYYDTVSYYDYENQINENNKTLVFLNSGYAGQVEDDIASVLK
jgi:hypothetical protein